jgi:hypothetical protein
MKRRPRSAHLAVVGPDADERPAARGLVACSVCLRVARGSAWIEAEEAIRDLRTFDFAEIVRLQPALCDRCTDRVESRRRLAA